MARAILFPCLLAALLLAQAGLSRAEESKGDALDSAFLQSWLQLDAKDAQRLQSEGAAAVAARRGLMQELSAANLAGEEMLPGTYQNNRYYSVNFTAVIVNMNRAQFTANNNRELNRYLGGVRSQNRNVCGASQTTIAFVKTMTNSGKNLNVVTVVAYPRFPATTQAINKAASQLFIWQLRNNVTGWLNNYRKGSFVIKPFTDTPGCAGLKYCIQCPSSTKCTRCVPNAEFPVGSGNVFDVYNTATNPAQGGRCMLCNKQKYCAVCQDGPSGLCRTCRTGYGRPVRGVCQCQVANPTLCADCNADPKVCTRCVAQSAGFSVFRNSRGNCQQCRIPGCATCRPNNTCNKCRVGWKKDKTGNRCVRA